MGFPSGHSSPYCADPSNVAYGDRSIEDAAGHVTQPVEKRAGCGQRAKAMGKDSQNLVVMSTVISWNRPQAPGNNHVPPLLSLLRPRFYSF
ncbi:hypothetical protein SKAU_G00216700 [Synaphobranchus kaupii]|uniref:Uncharacterized protein n=1 Tax=Synaphobranchus kaupii TaxID=118154 RepID=A0A9Q1FAE6_SYNKA|nr:hypothetical protein SKAU_G00216700 [Synaphobranchus kaupii]